MPEDIKLFDPIKWEDVKKGDAVWIAGNLEHGEPTKVYGIHFVVNAEKRLLKSGGNQRYFFERWDHLYVPKDLSAVLYARLHKLSMCTSHKCTIEKEESVTGTTIYLHGPVEIKGPIGIIAWCAYKDLNVQFYMDCREIIKKHTKEGA